MTLCAIVSVQLTSSCCFSSTADDFRLFCGDLGNEVNDEVSRPPPLESRFGAHFNI